MFPVVNEKKNLFFWNINPWIRSDRYLNTDVNSNKLNLSLNYRKVYVEKLSQTVLHINLVFANSDPVYNPKKAFRMYLRALSF